MRIKSKLLVSAGLAVFLGTVVSNIVAYRHFLDILQQKLLEEQQHQLDTITRQMDRVITDQKSVGASLSVEPRVQEYLRQTGDSGNGRIPRVLQTRNLMNHLNYLLTLQKNIEHATLIDREGNEVWTIFPVEIFAEAESIRPAEYAWPTGDMPRLVGPYMIRVRGEDLPFLGYSLPVHDVNDPNNRLGTLILHLSLDSFRKIFSADTLAFQNAQVRFNGRPVWSTDQTDLAALGQADSSSLYGDLPGEGGVDGNPANFHLLRSETEGGGIALQVGFSHQDLRSSLLPLARTFASITFLALLLYFLLLLPLLWKILLPLKELYLAVNRVAAGKLEERLTVRSGDELQTLSEQFNRMLVELQGHIENEVAAERRVRRSEYDLLLAQINPHFLYNTLNSVKILSHLGNRGAVDDVVNSLIEIMQKTVGKPGSLLMSTVGEELELVKKYLLIQKHQYRDLFTVLYHIDESALPLEVPGFILQPLVENALFHGIRPANRKGCMALTIQNGREGLSMTVADDGIGARPGGLDKRIHGKSGLKSIGLENIRSRLDFHYPDRHVFSIDTAPRKGFSVSIILKI